MALRGMSTPAALFLPAAAPATWGSGNSTARIPPGGWCRFPMAAWRRWRWSPGTARCGLQPSSEPRPLMPGRILLAMRNPSCPPVRIPGMDTAGTTAAVLAPLRHPGRAGGRGNAARQGTTRHVGTMRHRDPIRRRGLVLVVGLLLTLLAGCGSEDAPPAQGPQQEGAAGVVIVISDFTYDVPDSVPAGAQIAVRNDDDVGHTVTSDEEGMFDVAVAPGEEAVLTVPDQPGEYPFHCTPHPTMTATLMVE